MSKKYMIKKKVNRNEYKQVSEEIFKNSIFFTDLNMKYKYNYALDKTLFLYYDKTLIGYIEFGKSNEYLNEFGIKFLGILPKYRGKKLGNLLVNEIISNFKLYLNYIYLTIPDTANFLHKYYASLGFLDYCDQYFVKFESGFVGWFSLETTKELSKSNKILSQTKWQIMRYKAR